METIPVYEGKLPYIFISYAHANTPAVLQVAEELSAQGYRIWYDEGVEVGSEWPEYIAAHLAESGLMLAFLSNAYIRSDNCRKEMHFALSKKIPVVTVFLEETAMTPGMEMQIGTLFALMKYRMRDEEFYEKLLAAPQLDASLRDGGTPAGHKRPRRRKKVPVDLTVEARKQKKKKIRRVTAAGLALSLLIAVGVLGIVGWSTGLLPRVLIRRELSEPVVLDGGTAADFHSAALERIARDYSGIAEGELRVSDLAGLTELTLGGDAITPEALADLLFFPDLQHLTLSEAELASLAAMPGSGIETLTLERCSLTSLDGIGRLPRLRELSATDCPLRDLGDLGLCLELRRLVILGGFVHDYSSLRPLTGLTEVELSDCSLHELKPILSNSSLSELALTGCDLRGRFFRSFDRERAVVSLSLTDCELNSTKNLEDFTGLTTLRLIRSGEKLDFSPLASLDALQTVTADETMAATLTAALAESDAELVILSENDEQASS